MINRIKENVEDAIDKGRATARVYVPKKEAFFKGFRDYFNYDIRWSYWLVIGMVVLGAVVSFFIPHGWAIWPFVFIAGFMSMIHEAAERNGQGVPPFHVYLFLVGVVVFWIIVLAIFSLFNPIVLLIGVIALGYQCARAWIQDRERNRLIELRRASGQCVHCGEIVTNKNGVCEHCGNEPDPVGTRLRRVANIVNANKDGARARAAIKPASIAASASAKEQALLARSHYRQNRRPPRGR